MTNAHGARASDSCVIESDENGVLIDREGHRYSGLFDGEYVVFADANGNRLRGAWILGSGETKGIAGGGELDCRFQFTFKDHGAGNQRLNAGFTFAGTVGEAVAAFRRAGYFMSRLDNRFNREHAPPAGGELLHLRSRGRWLTGADSGHAILEVHPEIATPVSGQIHVGEHNPTRGMGVGFLLHQWELRSKR
ncbi:hypothetical protein [Silvibacterium dinghuense]|uniref:Uncharacterized protein n=1 Tax=Silvibacterium dinghuense TaxID=1560006 RepID=A0A4V1NVX1_9BACT|nr:hypothetical protein [Silvibacterium dinghuense]RXS97402.1 hypothetical protein ESZ00_05730 [Silvibacterium dinghuense]GGG98702.1 hypothetical protein GCM10011586_12670 [Silvibacterium dinghuense]